MKRIKILAVAVVAVLALSVLPSVASAASGFTADKYPVALNGVGTGGSHYLGFNSAVLACSEATLTGEAESSSAAQRVYPNLTGCKSSFVTAFAMNGCSLTLHPGAEFLPGQFSGTFDIGPAGCGPITTTVAPGCKITIPAQTGLGAEFTNSGSGTSASVTVKANASGLKYTQSGVCENGSFSNGTWKGSWAVKGQNPATKAAVGIHVAKDVPVGIFLAGAKSEVEGSQPRLEAELYPALVLGQQSATDKLVYTVNRGTVECETGKLEGAAWAPTTQLQFSPEQNNCLSFGYYNEVVNMNGCRYVFDIANAGPPYVGEMSIACLPGQKIEFGNALCKVSIGSQSGLGVGLKFANTGANSGRQITVDVDVSGIKYTETKGIFSMCAPPSGGTYENGSLGGTVTLSGS